MSLILVADDERHILELLHATLTFEGHDVLKAEDGREALAQMSADVALVMTDLIMPNQEGLETIGELRRQGYQQPVIAMTAGGLVGPREYLATARFIGANAVLAKPFSRDEALTLVRSQLAQSEVSPSVISA